MCTFIFEYIDLYYVWIKSFKLSTLCSSRCRHNCCRHCFQRLCRFAFRFPQDGGPCPTAVVWLFCWDTSSPFPRLSNALGAGWFLLLARTPSNRLGLRLKRSVTFKMLKKLRMHAWTVVDSGRGSGAVASHDTDKTGLSPPQFFYI